MLWLQWFAFSNHQYTLMSLTPLLFAGQTVQLQFRQHTDVAGRGFFTLIDDVVSVVDDDDEDDGEDHDGDDDGAEGDNDEEDDYD